ncbi:MAG: hypothetical protein GF364_19530 [Candidatus Lokiarchaeota archaeon]|nr:hypothetical protein [Candidatus Lokiarchaeota archaeon]
MNLDLPQYLERLMKMNILLLGFLALQMFIIPIYSGMNYLEYLPPGGIFWILCASWLLSIHFYSQPVGKILYLLTAVLTIFLHIYWLNIFSGPFDRMLQILMIFSLFFNVIGFIGSLFLPIMKLIQEKGAKLKSLKITIDKKLNDRSVGSLNLINSKGNTRKRIMILLFFFAGLIFTPLSVYDFGRTYHVKALDSATTRSSFWGPPDYDSQTVTNAITPIDSTTLLIDNSSLSSAPSYLCPGSIMYIEEVSHASTPGINYCNYSDGAESYPNGTVFLSSPLPTLMDVSIEFKYMKNSKIYSYLSEMNSRMVHTEWGGNQSWVESPKVFDNVKKTYEYLILEYWNISYFVNIHLDGYAYVNIYNYSPFTARATDVVDWIAMAQPTLNHCLGIAFDWEPKEVTIPSMNPDRPDMPTPPDSPFISQDKWYRLNEQEDETLKAAKTAYFNLYNHAESFGLSVYGTYVNWGMEDLAEGDIDYTRLPLWKHPNVEYGVMSYQSKDDDDEAMWEIYRMNRNQQRYYGEQGYSLLTGWLTFDEVVHLPYYTNDELGLQRYLRDIKMHQACGARELFHAPLNDLILKWGPEVVLEFEQALNEESKVEFVFKAYPWGHLDTALYDVAENYNKLWLAIPIMTLQIFILARLVPKLDQLIKHLINKSKRK